MMKFRLLYREFPDDMHGKARAFVLLKGDHAIICIDSWLPNEQQEKSLRHELAHLWLDHLIKPLPADADPDARFIDSESLEAEANRYAEAMTQDEFNALMQWAI